MSLDNLNRVYAIITRIGVDLANELWAGLPTYGVEAGTTGNRQPPSSTRSGPVSPLSPMYHTTASNTSNHLSPSHDSQILESEGLMSRSFGNRTELSGDAAPSMSELSPNSERLAINHPGRTAVPAVYQVDTVRGHGTGSSMRSNLQGSEPRFPAEGHGAGHKEHIMSWMEYDKDHPSPAR